MDWMKLGKIVVKYILPVGTTIGGILMADKMEKERMEELAEIVAKKMMKEGMKA